MDRRAVGKAADGAIESLNMKGAADTRAGSKDQPVLSIRDCLPKKTFPGYPSSM